MWVRISDGQIVNLDHYERVEVKEMEEFSDWALVAVSPASAHMSEQEEDVFEVLARRQKEKEAVSCLNDIANRLQNPEENIRSFCDLRV